MDILNIVLDILNTVLDVTLFTLGLYVVLSSISTGKLPGGVLDWVVLAGCIARVLALSK